MGGVGEGVDEEQGEGQRRRKSLGLEWMYPEQGYFHQI